MRSSVVFGTCMAMSEENKRRNNNSNQEEPSKILPVFLWFITRLFCPPLLIVDFFKNKDKKAVGLSLVGGLIIACVVFEAYRLNSKPTQEPRGYITCTEHGNQLVYGFEETAKCSQCGKEYKAHIW